MERDVLECNSVLYDRYCIRKHIGSGGIGLVYLAEDKRTHSSVAVKELFPYGRAYRNKSNNCIEFDGGEESVTEYYEVFYNEASILEKLSCFEHVVPYKDCFVENGTVYIVMDYIKGINLQQFIMESEELSVRECIDLLAPIFECIVNIHKLGIVHRDICPENIMVSDTSKMYVLDFGSAVDLNNNNSEVILAPTYRIGYSPIEQYKKDNSIGLYSDVYSLAATLYYCITKMKPSDAVKRENSDLQFPKDVNINKGLIEVFNNAFALNSDKRYRDVRLFREELLAVQSV